MDSYEATRVVFSRIQKLDPENASKIMGLLLIQDHGEKEMIRLAFGPESLVHSVILKARKELGFSSNTPSTPSTPSSPSPFSNSVSLSRQNSSSTTSSRLVNGMGNLPSPLSIPNPSSSWTNSSNFSDFQHPDDLISPGAYNNSTAPSSNGVSHLGIGSSPSTMNSSAPPFYRNGGGGNGETDLMDDYHLQEQLSFLNDGSPPLGPKSPDFFYPGQPDLASSPNGSDMLFPPYGGSAGWAGHGPGPHRRSCSVNDICLGGADDPAGGYGWKPCLYYAKGYCKNGNSCRFVHGGGLAESEMVGSPSKLEVMEQCQELLRSKSAHQQRLAAASQLMASSNFPYSPGKCMNLLLQQQPLQNDSPRAAAAAALMMGEEMSKFGRTRLERSEFSMGMGMVNPGSRQIYLTFPADSTFREEDVSNYFSMYGPVQDVRIPYQQKRMFGFVTFVYPETVKLILAKGNPHFVCDARVLVKPYKEKGKVPDKFRKQQQQQQIERGEYLACGSPTSFDSRDPFDIPLGARMLYNTQDMLWRRKLEEQADLQQAIELQNRRLMGLQLLDVKRNHHHRALSSGAAIPSPTHSPSFLGHSSFFHSHSGRSSPEEDDFVSRLGTPVVVSVDDHQTVNGYEKEKESSDLQSDENSYGNGNGKSSPHHEESDFQESLEHNLPDSLFASPKAVGDYRTAFSTDVDVVDKNVNGNAPLVTASLGTNNLITSPLLPATSTLDMASLKSCYFQVPRFASGHGAIGM